jgi:hypothetical protein
LDPNQRLPITATGIDQKVRLIYVPDGAAVRVMQLDASWRGVYFDPVGGGETDVALKLDDDGSCIVPPPASADWLLLLTR